MNNRISFFLGICFLLLFISCNSEEKLKCCVQYDKSAILEYFSNSKKAERYLVNVEGNRITRSFKKDNIEFESYQINDKGKVEYYNLYDYIRGNSSIVRFEWGKDGCVDVWGGLAMEIFRLGDRINTDTMGYRIHFPRIIGHKTELFVYEKSFDNMIDTDTTITSTITSPELILLMPKENSLGIDSVFIESKITSECSGKILSKLVFGVRVEE